jgi:hypothetical protein
LIRQLAAQLSSLAAALQNGATSPVSHIPLNICKHTSENTKAIMSRLSLSAVGSSACKPMSVKSRKPLVATARLSQQAVWEARPFLSAINGGNERRVPDWQAPGLKLSLALLSEGLKRGFVMNTGELVLKQQPKEEVQVDTFGYIPIAFSSSFVGSWREIWGSNMMVFTPAPYPWLSEEEFAKLYHCATTSPEPPSMAAYAAWCANLVTRFKLAMHPIPPTSTKPTRQATPSFRKAAAPRTHSNGSGGNGSRGSITAVGGGEEGQQGMVYCLQPIFRSTADNEQQQHETVSSLGSWMTSWL